jgi:hypothetical protein
MAHPNNQIKRSIGQHKVKQKERRTDMAEDRNVDKNTFNNGDVIAMKERIKEMTEVNVFMDIKKYGIQETKKRWSDEERAYIEMIENMKPQEYEAFEQNLIQKFHLVI